MFLPKADTLLNAGRDKQIEALVTQMFNRLTSRREAFIANAQADPTILLDLLDMEEELTECLGKVKPEHEVFPGLDELRRTVTDIVEEILGQEANDAA